MWGEINPEIRLFYETSQYIQSLPLKELQPAIEPAFERQMNTHVHFFISDAALATTIWNIKEDKLGFVAVDFIYKDPEFNKRYVVSTLYFNFVMVEKPSIQLN